LRFIEFRRLCLALPETEERETWGEATFRVRDRIFAMGPPDGGFVSIKASLDDQSGLVEMDPKTFAPSAYTGRYGWVRVRLAGVGADLAQRLVKGAWKRTAPRRLVAAYETGELRKAAGGTCSDRRRTRGRSEEGSQRR
jgi:hypothetical protein